LTGRELENHFPATSFISLHWFLVGSVEMISRDANAPPSPVPRLLINGKQGPLVSRNCGDLLYFGVSMYPDAFTAAFGIAPQDLEGRFLDATKALSPDGVALLGAVAAAKTDEDRIAIFEQYLETHVGDFKVSLWTAAVRAGARISVNLMSRLLNIGQRQTIRATKNALGVGVSDLRKFARGDAAFRGLDEKLRASASASLADIAAEAGYADQAHLSRECKSVTGRTPSEFVRDMEKEESDWIYRAMRSIRRN
jgi:AraC-like DNA-binding protein